MKCNIIKIDTAKHSTAQQSTAQHSTAQHSTAQHGTLDDRTSEFIIFVGEATFRINIGWTWHDISTH